MNTIFSKTFKTNRGIHGLLYNSTLCYMAVDSVVISCLLLIQLSQMSSRNRRPHKSFDSNLSIAEEDVVNAYLTE